MPAKKRFATVMPSKPSRAPLVRLLAALVLCLSLFAAPALSQDTEDSRIFVAGFNAYQQQDYATTIARMDELLAKHPDTTLRDMALFWLARAHYNSGHRQDAARVMARFVKEYPDSPLKGTVEEELLTLAAGYRGETIPPAAPEEQRKAATEKAEMERLAREKTERERAAALGSEQRRLEAEKEEKARLRDKAIEQYRAVVRGYPGSKAAEAAETKLRELGAAPQPAPHPAPAAGTEPPAGQQIFRLEVAQFAAFDLTLSPLPLTGDAAGRMEVPFRITNRGNGSDSFQLESGFPAGYESRFAAATAPGKALSATPTLAPGETFSGILGVTIPAASIDGQRISHPIRAVSRFAAEASHTRQVHLTAAAPLLRAIVKTDATSPLPGERLPYRLVLLNVGSSAARDVSLRLSYPPQLEPFEPSSSGFRQEGSATLALDGIKLASGERRELTISFRLKDDSLAGQELLCRAELINHPLGTMGIFVSNTASVKTRHGVLVRPAAERMVVIPGQTVAIPFTVTNAGNLRESFRIGRELVGAGQATVYHDLNRDGTRQPDEPAIDEIGPLEPKEEASLLMEVSSSRGNADASEGNAELTLAPRGDASRRASGASRLVYSRPVLQMAMSGGNGRLKPGDVASFDLTITNRGSNLARVVDLRSSWPELLEFVASEPEKSSLADGKILWKLKELGAGEKRTIRVSFRVKQGLGVGTSIQVSNELSYEDQLGNRY